jgi:NAD(P)-dependent dehydrogenase (short-subunit alcohol dehydrogenase family)
MGRLADKNILITGGNSRIGLLGCRSVFRDWDCWRRSALSAQRRKLPI